MRLAAVATCLSLALFCSVVSAADPDPLQDFCVADINSTTLVSGFACKPNDKVTVNDFFSSLLRPGSPAAPNVFVPNPLFVQQLGGLNTAGMGILRGELGVGAVNSPHIHPRATELNVIEYGKVQVGFVDTNNKLFIQVLEKGDVFVVPRGLVHFQFNVGNTPATFYSIFNSQNPGAERLQFTLFGSGIPDSILQKSFELSGDIVAQLKKQFSS